MATDMNILMGEIITHPEGEERDVEYLLLNFLRALIAEQEGNQ